VHVRQPAQQLHRVREGLPLGQAAPSLCEQLRYSAAVAQLEHERRAALVFADDQVFALENVLVPADVHLHARLGPHALGGCRGELLELDRHGELLAAAIDCRAAHDRSVPAAPELDGVLVDAVGTAREPTLERELQGRQLEVTP
jgi:hypothetical protein